MKKYLIYTFILFSLIVSSCDEKEDYEQIDSQVVDAAGEWWVKFSKTGYETGWLKVHTFNTAADDGKEMWIDDNGNWMDVKFKCPVNITNLTFEGSGLTSITSNNTVVVSNGKITKDGGQSTSGLTTDAISFEIELSSEPGVKYTATGTRKTGYLEDEH